MPGSWGFHYNLHSAQGVLMLKQCVEVLQFQSLVMQQNENLSHWNRPLQIRPVLPVMQEGSQSHDAAE